MRSLFSFLASSLIIIVAIVSCKLDIEKEPEFDSVEFLPKSGEFLFYDAEFSTGLYVTEISSGQVWKWQAGKNICAGTYAWSEYHRMFSFWGFPCANQSDGSPHELSRPYRLSLDNTLETFEAEKPSDGNFEHVWSPAGTQIAFPRLSYTPYYLSITDIFLQTYERQEFWQITDLPEGSVHSLDWSPDGKTIVFVYNPNGMARTQIIYAINPNDKSKINLLANLQGSVSNVQWSPDGQKLALIIDSSLWTMNADGSEQIQLFSPIESENSSGGSGVSSFAWSPDSYEIGFTSNHQSPCKRIIAGEDERRYEYVLCGSQTFIIDIDGGNMRQITDVISYGPIFRMFWIQR